MMAYIARVWSCVVCDSAVGEYLDGHIKHIEVKKSHGLMADRAKVIEKDHEPDIGIELSKPHRWWPIGGE